MANVIDPTVHSVLSEPFGLVGSSKETLHAARSHKKGKKSGAKRKRSASATDEPVDVPEHPPVKEQKSASPAGAPKRKGKKSGAKRRRSASAIDEPVDVPELPPVKEQKSESPVGAPKRKNKITDEDHVDKWDEDGQPREIVLTNCSEDIDDSHVKKHFAALGDNAIAKIIWILNDKGQKRGTCFVRFRAAELAKRAATEFALGLKIGTRPVLVKLNAPRENTAKADKKRNYKESEVFIGNCPWGITDRHVREHFNKLFGEGAVTGVRWSMDERNKFRGFGFIKFKDNVIAKAAAALKEATFMKRACNLSLRTSE